MANFKYFAEINGQTIELANVGHYGNGTKARDFRGFTPEGVKVAADRKIEFKSNPSMHKCGPRCLDAKGFLCECECGGKNHGKGAFMCEAA